MRGFSWTHLILAVLIIVFASMGSTYTWLVIILAAVIAVLSIFGVCSCGYSKKGSYNNKKEVKPVAPRKRRK